MRYRIDQRFCAGVQFVGRHIVLAARFGIEFRIAAKAPRHQVEFIVHFHGNFMHAAHG